MDDARLRIGEFSERVGVSPDLLRAWERRYGLLQPERSSGGFRLYTGDDVVRVQRMKALLDEGLAAAQAARKAIDEQAALGSLGNHVPPSSSGEALDTDIDRVLARLEQFDEPASHAIIDELMATLGVEVVVRDVLMPVMRRIGDRWEDGTLSVGQEHFATSVVRGRLLAVARGWGQGIGPRAVLAAPEGEDHDLGLVAFGLALWRRGWRITLLGANTPANSVVTVVRDVAPDALVLAAVDGARLRAAFPDLKQVSSTTRLAIGGRGASAELAEEIGATHLAGDVISAAGQLSTLYADR